MALKKLNSFLRFNYSDFAKGKTLSVTSVQPLDDYATKAHLGTKVEVVILKDDTAYADEGVSNVFEKFVFKVYKDVTPDIGALVEPVNPVATVYGDYRNQLSVKCDDLKVITAETKPTNPAGSKHPE